MHFIRVVHNFLNVYVVCLSFAMAGNNTLLQQMPLHMKDTSCALHAFTLQRYNKSLHLPPRLLKHVNNLNKLSKSAVNDYIQCLE